MKVCGILESVVDNTEHVFNPAIREFQVCETGFRTEQEAEQSLIDNGWKNAPLGHLLFALGNGAWIHKADERVRYVFEMEVGDAS